MVTGAKSGTSHSKLYNETGWPTLQQRRNEQKLIMFYKIMHRQDPGMLNRDTVQLVTERNPYNVRSRENLTQPQVRTTQYQASLIPETTKLWNNLPLSTRQINSLEKFKETIKSKIEPNQLYYTTRTRRAQVLHTRLRIKHSDLNDHLFRINLADDPGCDCGAERETIHHYLLECPTHQAHRNALLNSLQDLNQHLNAETLLSGSAALSINSNTRIFLEVQMYILKTKRFDK
jgi:hypothetical protein